MDLFHDSDWSNFNCIMDLFGTGLDGDKKTGKGFVLNMSFAADERFFWGDAIFLANFLLGGESKLRAK